MFDIIFVLPKGGGTEWLHSRGCAGRTKSLQRCKPGDLAERKLGQYDGNRCHFSLQCRS